jgi:vacuolar-type H+-ATPase subunit E/Vma4
MEEHPDSELLLKAVQDRAEQDRQEILAQGRDQVAKIKAQNDAAVQEIRVHAQGQAEQAITRERERLLGKAKADRRLALLDTKRRLLQAVFDQAEKEIQAVLQSDAYPEILSALICEALEVTGPDSQVEVAGADVALCRSAIKQRKLACTVKSAQERAGTLRVTSADGQKRVDNSLCMRLARAKVHCQSELARILFQARIDATGEGA